MPWIYLRCLEKKYQGIRVVRLLSREFQRLQGPQIISRNFSEISDLSEFSDTIFQELSGTLINFRPIRALRYHFSKAVRSFQNLRWFYLLVLLSIIVYSYYMQYSNFCLLLFGNLPTDTLIPFAPKCPLYKLQHAVNLLNNVSSAPLILLAICRSFKWLITNCSYFTLSPYSITDTMLPFLLISTSMRLTPCTCPYTLGIGGWAC